MTLDRRRFMTIAAAGAILHIFPWGRFANAMAAQKIKAVAFDGFPIFDPRPVLGTGKKLYGDKGGQFAVAFRTRLFEYQWLRALGNRYKDFFSIIDDAHRAAAGQLGVDASPENLSALKQAFMGLQAWPDVKDALKQLKDKDIGLALLSNMTPEMLNAGVENSGLAGLFDHVLSTDTIKTFKPDPRAYQLGVEAFGLPKEQIAFAAFAGWDAAGASWFGYPTVWVNRLGFKADLLDAQLAAEGRDLATLTRYIAGSG